MKIVTNNITVNLTHIFWAYLGRNKLIFILTPIALLGCILGFTLEDTGTNAVAMLIAFFLFLFLDLLIILRITFSFMFSKYLNRPSGFEITDEAIYIKYYDGFIKNVPNDSLLKVIRKGHYYILKYHRRTYILPGEVLKNSVERQFFESTYTIKK